MEPSLAGILLHIQAGSQSVLFSAIGYWKTEENRKTTCIFIQREVIYLFTLRHSVLESYLTSKGGKDIKRYAFTGNIQDQQFLE